MGSVKSLLILAPTYVAYDVCGIANDALSTNGSGEAITGILQVSLVEFIVVWISDEGITKFIRISEAARALESGGKWVRGEVIDEGVSSFPFDEGRKAIEFSESTTSQTVL